MIFSTGAAQLGITTASTNYISVGSAGATEAFQNFQPSQLVKLSNGNCYVANAPGASNSYVFTLHECDLTGASCTDVGTPGAITITVSGTSKVGSDLTNSYTFVTNKTYELKSVLTVGGTPPTNSTARCTFTAQAN